MKAAHVPSCRAGGSKAVTFQRHTALVLPLSRSLAPSPPASPQPRPDVTVQARRNRKGSLSPGLSPGSNGGSGDGSYLGKRRSSGNTSSSSNGSSSSASGPQAASDVLNAFFYGRALAITLNKRLSEAAIDLVSEISKRAAERPQRIKAFQDEVEALARKEMLSSNLPAEQSGSGSSSGGAAGERPAALQDPQAAVDELRAEIAYARASLQQIKLAKSSVAAQN